MIHPPTPRSPAQGGPRRSRRAGHLLRPAAVVSASGMADNDIAWFHFNPLGGRDARGCRVECVDAAHDVAGIERPPSPSPELSAWTRIACVAGCRSSSHASSPLAPLRPGRLASLAPTRPRSRGCG